MQYFLKIKQRIEHFLRVEVKDFHYYDVVHAYTFESVTCHIKGTAQVVLYLLYLLFKQFCSKKYSVVLYTNTLQTKDLFGRYISEQSGFTTTAPEILVINKS